MKQGDYVMAKGSWNRHVFGKVVKVWKKRCLVELERERIVTESEVDDWVVLREVNHEKV
jgi:hypothetical protein